MKKKKRSENWKKRESIFLIVNLIIAVFAFSFIINSTIVSAEEVVDINNNVVGTWDGKSFTQIGDGSKILDSSALRSKTSGNIIGYWIDKKFEADTSSTASNSPSTHQPNVAGGVVGASVVSKIPKNLGIAQVTGGWKSVSQLSTKTASGAEKLIYASEGKNLMINSKERLAVLYGKDGLPEKQFNFMGSEENGVWFESEAVAGGAGAASKPLTSWFGLSGTLGKIVETAAWALAAYGIGQMIGGFLGFDKKQTQALSTALALGATAFQGLQQFLKVSATKAFWIGIGVAAVVFIMMYKKTSTQTVTFECKPYEAPTGGSYCELCNKDPLRPCTEYRCKSLGQACEVRPGREGEICVWVNRNDVTSPTITPWTDALTKDHSYKPLATRPVSRGTRIVNNIATDGCIKAFTPLTFGISTNEPTQCKIDYNHTVSVRKVKEAYDSMEYYFGESNVYEYNHSQTLRLPGPAALAAQNISPEIGLDGVFTLYVRCQDANGNVNEDEFAIQFCVEKGPDTTPPVIEGTSIPSGMPVSFNTNDTDIEVYVNEPSDCRWSTQDKKYDLMETQMTCDRNVWEMNTNMLYKCYTKLTGLENRKDNQFYFRCKDQPYLENENDRITMQESYAYIVKGSQPLNIKVNSIKPNGTVQGYADVVSVDLTLETENGYNKGDAICYFSSSTVESTFIKMFETGTNKHKQNQRLAPGGYVYYFKCVDLGGNADYNQTSFIVEVDRISPQVARIYNEGSNLRVETDEKSTCYYSSNVNNKCNFELKDGKQMLYQNVTAHYIEWKTDTSVYIKCVDMSGNQPNPLDCSIIVKPYNLK